MTSARRTTRVRLALDAAAAALLCILTTLLYRGVVRLSWTYDDPFNLRLIHQHPFVASFTSGELWPQQLFTPLMLAWFDFCLALFALDTAHWYVAQLALFAVTAIAVYGALRLFLAPAPSLAAAATFIAGVPLCSIVTQLSTVHYLLAILACALSLIAFVHGQRRGSVVLTLVSALLYLVALLAKEVAILLPLLLLALASGNWRSRIRSVVPHAIAGILYFAWRYAVLGTFLGDYGWVIESRDWPQLLAELPWNVVKGAAGPALPVGLLLLALMLVPLVIAAIRSRRALLLIVVAAVVAIAPILPVAKEVNRRYVAVPWLAWSVASIVAIGSIRDRRVRGALLVAVPLLTIAINRQEWASEYAARAQMSDEARFYLGIPVNGLLRKPTTPPATMRELMWLKTNRLMRPFGSSWFYDDFYLCVNDVAGKRVWQYEREGGSVVEITNRVPQLARNHCTSIRNAPLEIAFQFRDSALYWDFGPYREGTYTALLAEGWEAFVVPRSDALYLPGMTVLPIRVRYDSPAGWTTYSPQFVLDLAETHDYRWRRKSANR